MFNKFDDGRELARLGVSLAGVDACLTSLMMVLYRDGMVFE